MFFGTLANTIVPAGSTYGFTTKNLTSTSVSYKNGAISQAIILTMRES